MDSRDSISSLGILIQSLLTDTGCQLWMGPKARTGSTAGLGNGASGPVIQATECGGCYSIRSVPDGKNGVWHS